MASTSVSSIQNSFKYDVFLSFRGEDTRKTFVDHLYHALTQKGIETYKDDENIKQGNMISDELIKAIEDSKFYIIIFSKNYASSSWCLEELVKIMEFQKGFGHTAYPVFYDVEPTEVRKQIGSVGNAFAKHKEHEAAGKWREALKEASDLAGWEMKSIANGHEAKFIQKIVQEISLELRSINFGLDEKLVGMETRVEDVVSSLETSVGDVRMLGIWGMGGAGKTTLARAIVQEISLELRSINFGLDEKLVGMETRVEDVVSSLETSVGDVRMLGIWGMGGAGKTTLARAVFDQIYFKFEGQSFVENVREESKPSLSGLKSLQKQVLSDISNDQGVTVSGVLDGKNKMKKMMRDRKVLVVLDDVDHKDQLEALVGDCNWFKPGSRIIITTREKQVLIAHGVRLVHNVTLLSQAEAGCLFSRYVFGRENPIQGYEELSGKVLKYAHGLPLTIKVLGSFLCGQSEPYWIDVIERLKTIPLEATMKRLEISFDGLENDYKEIFLDVACILKGWIKKDAIRALESRGFHAEVGLRVLEQKSLITISKNWEGKLCLGMHDHLEEMGRNIVRRSHPDEPQRHSRLWIRNEIKYILSNDLGTQATKCLYFNPPEGCSAEIAVKGLSKMKDLRFIHIDLPNEDSDLEEDYFEDSDLEEDNIVEYLPSSLRFMSWNVFPFSSLPNTFQGKYLVQLEISFSNIVQLWEDGEEKVLHKLRFLTIRYSKLQTFDLRLAPNLEQLTIDRCHDFEELHMPAPHLKLKYLNLSQSKLKTLDLGLTPNLKSLNLENCYDLVEMNAPVGYLRNLAFLDLSGCGRFKSFVFDKYKWSQPAEAGSVSELHLIAEPTDVCLLHPNNSFPKFRFECYYKEDPNSSFGNLERLISLGLCACTNLENFSRSICSLHGLRKLTLEGSITEAPPDLDQLECLEELTFSTTEIKHLPDSICKLKYLKSFEIKSCCLLEKLPEDIGRLESLEKLILTDCKLLQDIPDSLCKLKYLKSFEIKSCCLLEKLPEDIGRLESLEKLILTDCKLLQDIPDSLCKLKYLKSFEIKSCCLLEKLPEDIGRLESLEKLILTDCKLLQDIPSSICKMKCINSFDLRGCIRVVELPEDIGCLEGLKELNIEGTGITRLPQSIFQLRGLRIVGPMQLRDISGLLIRKRRTSHDDEIIGYI
ncbi:disease resistance protein (TIR-NBS-LRR class) family [Artemisia annua]|uniref:Disease resistance protein (TIR-NBS-LRR class) family n=1 Tax=Artemisia annua TaxID=35608 RepID=A0A2U1LNQ2_ARTAN|nr:disease resistance protein (TIR-NBS-LRR class) family [Artemisia annua]